MQEHPLLANYYRWQNSLMTSASAACLVAVRENSIATACSSKVVAANTNHRVGIETFSRDRQSD